MFWGGPQDHFGMLAGFQKAVIFICICWLGVARWNYFSNMWDTRGATCVVGGRVGMDETHQVNIHFNWDNLSFFLLPFSFFLSSSWWSQLLLCSIVFVLIFIFVFVVVFCHSGLLQLPFVHCFCLCFIFVFRLSSLPARVSCSSAVCWSCVQIALLASALRVLPAETRLTVYRRL